MRGLGNSLCPHAAPQKRLGRRNMTRNERKRRHRLRMREEARALAAALADGKMTLTGDVELPAAESSDSSSDRCTSSFACINVFS